MDNGCWLVVEASATMEQDQIPKVRVRELPEIRMSREEDETEAQEKVKVPEKMEVETGEKPRGEEREPDEK